MLDKEIVDDFKAEAAGLLTELTELVEVLEEVTDRFPGQELEQFAQRIDRIMGAAKTLSQFEPGHQGLIRIGVIAQLCKQLGYKASEYKVAPLVPIFAAFWADSLEVLSELINNVEDEAKSQALANSFSSTLQKRLQWLGERVQKYSPAGLGMDNLVGKLAGK